MTQPTVKILQLDQTELASFVEGVIGSPVGSSLNSLTDVVITGPSNTEVLTYGGSPITWRNLPTASGITNIIGGDGITVTGGSPERTIDVDSTVARRDATNTFQQANTFTASLSGISVAPFFAQSAAPGTIFDDTGAAADESIWRNFASSGQLVFDARNDANNTSTNWLTVDRSGTTIDTIAFTGTSLTFNGVPIHVGSPVGVGSGNVTNSGTPVNNQLAIWTDATTIEGDTSLQWDGTDLDISGTGGLVITNGSGAVAIRHGGTDVNITHASTTDWNISGLSGNLSLRAGIGLQLVASNDSDQAVIIHDGSRVTFDGNLVNGFRFNDQLQVLGSFKLYNTGSPQVYVNFFHDGSNLTINGSGSTGSVILTNYAIENVSSTPSGTTETLTYSAGPAFEVDLESASGNMTVTLSGGPPVGKYGQMIVRVTQDSATARTVTFTTAGTITWTGSPAHPMTTTLDGTTLYNFEIWGGSPTIFYAAGADYNN